MNLRTLFFLIFLLLSLSVLQAQVTRSGPLPDAHGYTPEGEPVKLRELTKGHYTVLAAGCLTCPEFHRGYTEVELAHADYANKGVRFFYIYKSLRHPELNGYIEPQNLEERLLHLAVAREKLGTKPPWIADSMDDSIRIGLGAGANSIYIISPEGEILHGAERLRSLDLRATLAKLVE